jgi:glycerol-3-phosphate dehydrogenase (NAD(P)+)
MSQHSIVVAGAGVFGTAIAQRLSWNKNNTVVLYTIEEDVVHDINTNGQNAKYFPGRQINTEISATSDITCVKDADILFLAIPSKVIESYTSEIAPIVKEDLLLVNLSKGLAEDGSFLTDSIHLPRSGSLKGPTFAVRVMDGDPSGMTFGGNKEDYLLLKEVMKKTGITLDHSTDIRAVEFLSVLKNMYAVALGIVSGRYSSPNVDFLVLTKVIGEMRKMLRLYECDEETLFNYCGFGDLGLTALNDLSRNRTLGLLLGKGFNTQEKSSTVVEGKRTIKLLGEMIREKEMIQEFPVLEALYELLYNGSSLNDYYMAVLS